MHRSCLRVMAYGNREGIAALYDDDDGRVSEKRCRSSQQTGAFSVFVVIACDTLPVWVYANCSLLHIAPVSW